MWGRAAKGADKAGARIRSAADDLDGRARAGIHRQHLELVGLRMLLGRQDPRDHEGLEGGAVIDVLDLEADHGQCRSQIASSEASFSR